MDLNKKFKAQASAEVRRLIIENPRALEIVERMYNENGFIYNEDEVAKLLGITKAKLRFCRDNGMIHTINHGSPQHYDIYSVVRFLAYQSKSIWKKKGGNP